MVIDIPLQVLQAGDAAVAHYEECMKNDCGENLSLILALKRAPGLNGTNDAFLRGHRLDPFPNMTEPMRQWYMKECRRKGIDFSGKVYKSGLVRDGFEGTIDPEAFVGSRDELKDKIVSRGWSTEEGMVEVEAPEIKDDAGGGYKVSHDLVMQSVAAEVLENHNGRIPKKQYADLVEKTKTRLAGVQE